MGCRNNFRRQWIDLSTGKDDAIKIDLNPTLAHKVSGVLIVLEVAAKFRASGKYRTPEGRDVSQITKHRIADLRGFGREVGFIQGALQKRSGGNELIIGHSSSYDASRNTQKNCQKEVLSGHTSVSSGSSLRSAPHAALPQSGGHLTTDNDGIPRLG